jgi:hypothetical protein
MSLNIRRVVTGHTVDGRVKVEIDEIAKNVISIPTIDVADTSLAFGACSYLSCLHLKMRIS